MTECGRDHFACSLVILQIDHLKIGQHLLSGNIRAQKRIDFIRAEGDSHRLFLFGIYIHNAADHFSCSQLFNQLAGTVNGCLCIVRIQSFFKFG